MCTYHSMFPWVIPRTVTSSCPSPLENPMKTTEASMGTALDSLPLWELISVHLVYYNVFTPNKCSYLNKIEFSHVSQTEIILSMWWSLRRQENMRLALLCHSLLEKGDECVNLFTIFFYTWIQWDVVNKNVTLRRHLNKLWLIRHSWSMVKWKSEWSTVISGYKLCKNIVLRD